MGHYNANHTTRRICSWILPFVFFTAVTARSCTYKQKLDIFDRMNMTQEDDCTVPFPESPLKAIYGCLTNKTCIAVKSKPDHPEEPNCIESLLCKQLIGHYVIPGTAFDSKNKALVFHLYTTHKLSIGLGISESKNAKSELFLKCQQSKNGPSISYGWVDKNMAVANLDSHAIAYPNKTANAFWTGKAISCRIPMNLKFKIRHPKTKKTHFFDFTKKKYCLQIYSDSVGTKLKRVLRCSTPKELDYRLQPTQDQTILAIYHGIGMIIAWVLVIPTANFIGRHFKKGTKICCKCCKIRPWLVFHVLLVLLSIPILGVSKFTNILYKRHWKHVDSTLVYQHGILGYTSMALLGLNLILGFTVKSKAASTTANIVANIHSFTCELATLLCGVVISIAPGLPYTNVTCNVREVGVGWMIWYLGANVTMSLQEFWMPLLAGRKPVTHLATALSKSEALKVITVSYVNAAAADKLHKKEEDEQEPLGYTIVRGISLALFIISAIVFAIALSLMLYFPPDAPCWVGESTHYFEKVVTEGIDY